MGARPLTAIALLVISVGLLAVCELVHQIRRLQKIASGQTSAPRPTGPIIDVPGEDLVPTKERRRWRKLRR